MDKPRIVVITGPTASGRSELAVRWARYLGGEVVGADSRQVYRFLDVGTAKPGPAQRRAVAHHLLDVADPDEPFDVARYVGLARPRRGRDGSLHQGPHGRSLHGAEGRRGAAGEA